MTRPDGESQRPCARGDRCANRDAKGNPLPGPRPFCDDDRATVGRALTALPDLYLELAMTLGEKGSSGGPKVATTKTAPLPVRLDIDALMRDTLYLVSSWDERVRAIARLAGPDTAHSRQRRDDRALTRMATMLAAHLDALLALPAEPMARHATLEQAAEHAAAGALGVVHSGEWAEVLLDLSGADAGLELLALERRIRRTLGWTPQHEDLAVPCWGCGNRTLRRWDGNAGLAEEVECMTPGCGELYLDERYELLMTELSESRAGERRKAS